MLQSTALDILKSGKNVFLTGSAGAGKTYLINQYIEYLRDRGIPVAVTASTGIAATHIGGQTIHSWSGLGIKEEITDRDLDRIAKRKPVREKLEKAQVLIIDEISMLSAQHLHCLDQILRFFKVSFEPFGGIQIIFSGDFFQLPPVSRTREPSYKRLAFMAPVWLELDLKICYLTEQFRSGDSTLINILNEIRSGEISDSTQDAFWEKLEDSQNKKDDEAIKLFTHNADVDVVNWETLGKLKTPIEDFYAKTQGAKNLVDSLKKSVLAPECLQLRIGAQVMFVKNNYECGYLNGTMGTVTGFDTEGWPVVTTFDNIEIVAQSVDWQVVDQFNKPVARYSQIPLRLAWAITIHKSQGMTLDRAVMDLSKTFEPGQGYVALSRVKTWQHLTLLGCNQQALVMDELVMRADGRLQELSGETEEAYKKINNKELEQSFDDFILRVGGTTLESQIAINHQKNKQKQEIKVKIKISKKSKVSTYEKTKQLVQAQKTLSEIALERSLSENTIISHLEKLVKDFPDLDLSIYRPEEGLISVVQEAIAKLKEKSIKEDFDKDGYMKLGLIHRELKGKYDYDEIRLARVFH